MISVFFRKVILIMSVMLVVQEASCDGLESLRGAIDAISGHVQNTSSLTGAQINAQTEIIKNNIRYVGDTKDIIEDAFQCVQVFEASSYGWLFMNAATKNGFSRSNTSGKELYHAMFALQQGMIDYAYTVDNIAKYPDLFSGLKFETAYYFPGAVDAPENSDTTFIVKVNASQPKAWGSPVSGENGTARRPTGCYVAPGSVVTVTVPESLVGKGYVIRVGAHSWDLVKKTTIKRLDRVSLVFPINSTEVMVANPLGGGIYIEVPYLADAGVVDIEIKNAVRSPFFSARSFDKTTLEEWKNEERNNDAPWADFESDKFMMQVPTGWIYKLEDPVTLMEDWDKAMDAISELFGLPLIRPKTVLYTQVDVMMRGNANYPGYPQSNYPYKPYDAVDGYEDHWMVRGPQHVDWTVFHEVGHSQMFTKFYGEIESTVNLPYVAIQNKKFGMDLDLAYGNSISDWSQITLDQGAIMWMVTENFRAGKPMSKTNKPGDEVKYQHRGHGKYVEIAKLFGWEALEKFWYEVNVDYMDDKSDYPSNFNEDPNDSRILRLSQAAGVDLRPLIHFWGVQPDNAALLKDTFKDKGLEASPLIYDELEHYKTIIPMNNDEFNAHAKVVYPNGPRSGQNPLYGDGWYETWMPKYSVAHGVAAKAALQDIIDLYFPWGRPLSSTEINMKSKTGASIYPNPVNNLVIIDAEYEIDNVVVCDVSGCVQDVKSCLKGDNCTVDVGGLSSGVYLVTIHGLNKLETSRFIKQ